MLFLDIFSVIVFYFSMTRSTYKSFTFWQTYSKLHKKLFEVFDPHQQIQENRIKFFFTTKSFFRDIFLKKVLFWQEQDDIQVQGIFSYQPDQPDTTKTTITITKIIQGLIGLTVNFLITVNLSVETFHSF